jgi:chromosome segregation ATPase
MRLSTGTLPDDAGDASLDEYVAALQAKEEFYFTQLAAMKQQILTINSEYLRKEEELSAACREAVSSNQVLHAELSIFSESHQRLLRSNAELEERLETLQAQIAELNGRNDFLESERIQGLTSLELPHPDILKDVAVAIAEREIAVSVKDAAKAELVLLREKLSTSLVAETEKSDHIKSLNQSFSDLQTKHATELELQKSEIGQVARQYELTSAEVTNTRGVVEALQGELEGRRSREQELLTQIEDLSRAVEQSHDSLRAQAVNLEQQKSQGKSQASEAIATLYAEITQVRGDAKTANERLHQALAEAAVVHEKMTQMEALLTNEQMSKVNTTPKKTAKSDPTMELRKLLIETTELRLKLAELQASKENRSSWKRKADEMTDEEGNRNRRVSLDQEECRQQ